MAHIVITPEELSWTANKTWPSLCGGTSAPPAELLMFNQRLPYFFRRDRCPPA
ncbi:hypothetical protein ENTCAN_08619 [Enterobacter cancerogenus ATCC 35316]|nr:hypothetical protein ENTCAN_08619 [Enterobacter cancerogenus ATCC 35316]